MKAIFFPFAFISFIMASNTKPRERKSLCEESMLVLANILRLSSLSLARKTLAGTTIIDDHHPQASPPPSLSSHKKKIAPINKSPSLAQMLEGNGSKRAQKPEHGSKFSYVVSPADDDEVEALSSSYVVHEVNTNSSDGRFTDYIERFHQKTENDLKNAIVGGKADDYINKFHEKNRNDANNESKRFSSYYALPPPPRQV